MSRADKEFERICREELEAGETVVVSREYYCPHTLSNPQSEVYREAFHYAVSHPGKWFAAGELYPFHGNRFTAKRRTFLRLWKNGIFDDRNFERRRQSEASACEVKLKSGGANEASR